MKRITLLAVLISALVGFSARPAMASGITLYNTIPDPLDPNIPSWPYELGHTTEWGQAITLAGGQYDLSVTVAISNLAVKSHYDPGGISTGFSVPLTLNLYNDPGAGGPVGAAFATQTVVAFFEWRPEADPTCSPEPRDYRAADGKCYIGALQLVPFLLPNLSLPSNLIFGLSFNTEHYGPAPVGTPGPYNDLNFALSLSSPTAGSNTYPGPTTYWNTPDAASYSDHGAGGFGTFRQDAGWANETPAVRFEAAETPEPASMFLMGTGLIGLASRARKRLRKK